MPVQPSTRPTQPKPGRTFRFEIDVVNHVKRIHYFTRRVARSVLPIEEQATESEPA